MDKPPPTIKGRKIAVLVGGGVDAAEVQGALATFAKAELVAETIGPTAGSVKASGKPMKVNRAAPNAPSVVYDAVLVPAGIGAALAAMPLAQRFIHEAYRHGKPIAVAPDAEALLDAAGVPAAAEGIVIGQGSKLLTEFVKNIGQHRFPRRVSVLKPS
jgi:catalase